MKRLLLSLALLAPCAVQAVELMKWERIPLPVPLNVGQERIVFVDKNVRVGFPATLNGKMRIQSSGGAVYLQAEEAFPVTRLQLQDLENGELILLDVSARTEKPRWSRSGWFTPGKSRRRAPAIREPCQGVTPAVKGKTARLVKAK